MNRLSRSDSKHSLDVRFRKRNDLGMIIQRYHLYLERTSKAKNIARFYSISIEPNLFGDPCLTRRWGRIGTMGQRMVHHCGAEKEAVVRFLELLRQKRARGYSTVPGGSADNY
nr:WGR domain-containing protein [Rhizobium daejeonense]